MNVVRWNSDVSGSWTTASNWDDNVVPDSVNDQVTLATGAAAYTVTFAGANDVVGSLEVESKTTLDIASGALTIGGVDNDGELYNDGAINVAAGASLGIAGGYGGILGSGTLTLAGTLTMEAGSYPLSYGGVIDLAGGAIRGAASASFFLINDDAISGYGAIGDGYGVSTGGSGDQNSPGLVLFITKASTVDASGAAGKTLVLDTGDNTIESAGLIEATGAGGLAIDSSVFQDGTLHVAAGSVATIADGARVGGLGATSVAAGGKLVLNDGIYASSGVLDIGAPGGELTTVAGDVGAKADQVLSSFNNDGAVDVVANSTLALDADVFDGASGQINLDASTTAAAIVEMANSGSTIYGGKIVLTDSVKNEFLSEGAYTQLSNESTLTGAGVIGDGYLRLFNGAAGVIDANGAAGLKIEADTLALNQSASNEADFSVGLIEATAAGASASDIGLLTFGAGQFGNAGEILAAKQGEVLLDGVQINGGGGQLYVASGGKLELEAGAEVYNQAFLTVAAGGVLSTASDGTTDAIESDLFLSGALDVSANSDLIAANKWVGTGVVNLGGTAGGATLTVLTGGSLDLWGADTLNLLNAKDKVVAGGAGSQFRNRDGGKIVGEGAIGDANLNIVNAAGGVFDASGALTLGFSASAPEIQNGGVLETTGSGVLTLLSYVNNTGELVANTGGKIIADQNINNSGRVDLDGGSAEFVGLCYSMLQFEGGVKSALLFDNTSNEEGYIAGFTTGDTIDLMKFAYGDGVFTNVGGYGPQSGFPAFENSLGQTSQSFSLLGDYEAAAGSFSFSKDSGGGTIIHWTPKS